MPDVKRYAAALAVVALAGCFVTVVGLAVMATQYVNVWLGITVVGAAAAIVGFVGIFAVGMVEDQYGDAGRGGRW